MITQELLAYIREELAKGRTREEIHATLVADGGWSESDLSEAFRTAIPMEYNILPAGKKPPFLKFLLVFIAILAIAFGLWYYSPQIMNFWNFAQRNIRNIFAPSFDTKFANQNPVIDKEVVLPPVKDCGVSLSPNLNNPSNTADPVFACLGASALSCENAKGIIDDDIFPTIFEITKTQNSCNFKLSYPADSTLTYVNGKKVALEYIACPISIVKVANDPNASNPQFIAPDKTNPTKYASQIYFYGALGLFVENNLDQNKIKALGCSGGYIDSVIASYRLTQTE